MKGTRQEIFKQVIFEQKTLDNKPFYSTKDLGVEIFDKKLFTVGP